MKNSLNVVITGDDEKGKDLVSAIVSKSLAEHGFTNVTHVNAVGEPSVGVPFQTIFDAVRAGNPGLFAAPVRIWTSNGIGSDADNEETVGALNGVPVEDQQFIEDAIEADVATEEPVPA